MKDPPFHFVLVYTMLSPWTIWLIPYLYFNFLLNTYITAYASLFNFDFCFDKNIIFMEGIVFLIKDHKCADHFFEKSWWVDILIIIVS